jgi:hypothetical protein
LWKAISGLEAERQILFDTIDVRWPNELILPQPPAAFGFFVLEQMASPAPLRKILPLAVILKRLATDFLVLFPLGRRI